MTGPVVRVVTTMNRAGWRQTGFRMADSFVERWPRDVELIVYAEDFELPDRPAISLRLLPKWLDEFKARHRNNKSAHGRMPTRYDFRFDCVKFAHKVAAVTDAGLRQDDGLLIWMDADTFTHAPVTHDWLLGLFPEPAYIAWLDRVNHYPETGFYMLRCSHRSHRLAMQSYQEMYTSDQVFRLKETHDCWALRDLIDGMVRSGDIEAPVSLSGDPRWSHPFVAGPLGACMDHMKGLERKRQGHSTAFDTRKPRCEPYWQNISKRR